MASSKISGVMGIIIIGLGAIAFITNPGEKGYQKYAEATFKTRFKDKVCAQVMEDWGVWLESQCHIVVNTASPYLTQIVSQQTERQNFLLFSIYQADLPLPSPFPTYHLETVGILGNFYTYQAKKL